jgi:integrase
MRHCPRCKEVVGQGDLVNKKAKSKDRKYRCPKCYPKFEIDLTEVPRVDLHIHDLRRSLGSWQAALGASLVVIGKSLGHADLKSTQVYSRLMVDPIKESVGKAAQAMLDASGTTVLDLFADSTG